VFCGPIEGHAFLDAELPDAVNGSAVKVRETWNSKNRIQDHGFLLGHPKINHWQVSQKKISIDVCVGSWILRHPH